MNEEPPLGWYKDPDKLASESFTTLIENQEGYRFRVQFGAQFSMAAHAMQDFYDWHDLEGNSVDEIQKLCGSSPQDFQQLARKFYEFRQFVNPEHISDIV